MTNRAVAGIFTVDLMGAACGALVVSTVLIPYLGLDGTAAGLIGIKVISLLVMGGRYVSDRPTRISGG